MVVGAFPAAKLGAILLKQISKPIATGIKNQAKQSPFFRKYICMPPAQFYNWCEVKTKMWILNLGKPVHIPSLTESMAIELGANLLGEGIIFLIAAGVLIAEYNRSARKEAKKEEEAKAQMQKLNDDLREMFLQVEEQRTIIRELSRAIGDLHSNWKIFSRERKPVFDPEELPALSALESEELAKRPEDTDERHKSKLKSKNLLEVLDVIERELFPEDSSERDLSTFSLALNYVYKDVLNLPIKMV